MKHSTLGASSAYRWMACPGCPALCAKAPKPKPSPYAQEGTEAHSWAEKALSTVLLDQPDTLVPDPFAPHIKLYVDTVLADYKALGEPEVFIEEKFNLEEIHPGMFGTNDCCLYEEFGKLVVYDFKYGAGIPVEVKGNVQMMYYALGALLRYPEVDEVEIVIVQPRADHRDGPVRRWSISPKDLLEWGTTTLRDAAFATTKEDASLVHGDHCRFCPALTICPEVQKEIFESAKQAFSPIKTTQDIHIPNPSDMTPEDLARWMRIRDLFVSFDKEVQGHVKDQLQKGNTIPGFKVVAGRGSRAWEVAESEVNHLFKGFDCYEHKLKSPAQMEKHYKEKTGCTLKEAKAKINCYTKTVPGKPTVAPEDDRRPALAPSIQSAFKKLS